MSETQTLHALSRNTISLIGSCQVITSVYSVVKELIENSLDAAASSVDIKLDDFGLQKIDVCDNGSGIKGVDVPFMAKRHFTSKISSSEDLDSLTTYGFRGEALGSLCAVSHTTITTKTCEDQLSYIYTIGPEGDVLDKKPSHNGKGTIVSSKNLFYNVPVRKQYYSGSQRKKDDLKRIEHLLMMYAIVKPDLRLTLKHGKDLVFQKTALKDVKTALHSVLGRQIANQMLYKEKYREEQQIKLCAFLPKPGSDVRDMSMASSDKTFVAVNKRPVSVSELNKVLKSYYSNCHGLDIYRHPVCFISIDVCPNQVDVNVDPNKTKVFFQQKTDIITALEEILVEIYGPLENVPSWHYRNPGDDGDTPKETDRTPVKEIKNSVRPFITYSKRLGESETLGSESHDGKLNGSSNQGTTYNNARSLPSFSAAFHTTPSIEIVHHSSEENSTSSKGSSERNIATDGLTQDIELSSNLNTANENSDSYAQELISDNSNAHLHESSKETSVKGVHENEGSTVVDELTCEFTILKDNDTGLSSENKTTPPQPETTAKENEETNNKRVGKSLSSEEELCTIIETNATANSKDVDTERSVSNIGLSEWSRGNLSVGSALLQPVKLLPPSSTHVPGKRPPSPSKAFESSQPQRKSAKLMSLSNQATLFDMKVTQKLKEPESPFTHFYQEKSPILSQEFPNDDTTKLKERLKEEWENMTDDERITYREKCWKDTKRYEKDKISLSEQHEAESTSGKETKSVLKSTEKLKKPLKKRLYCKECCIKIPMNKIRNSTKQGEEMSINDRDPKIIGLAPDSEDVWLCTVRNKLYLVNLWRLAEVSLYKNLRAEHVIPFQPCDTLALDSRTISERSISVLESLSKKCRGGGTYFHISDRRLVANGFDVKCHFDPNGNLTCQLVGICNVIPAYDVKDLNVVLEVVSNDADASLSKTRTLKAAFYLQGEAVRMTRQTTGKKSSHDAQTLLKAAVNKTDQPCLHHKPIFQELIDLSVSRTDDEGMHD